MKLSAREIAAFQTKILSWYDSHQRDLPWRRDRDPYHILISEVMLQQTQVQRVIPKYEAWLQTFPTVAVLAKASTHDVLRSWSGLGYNRRALSLKKAAEVIVRRYNGVFPQSREALKTLPGIGVYTSAALSCFAFDVQIPVIDTNIRKVITHEYFSGILPSEKVIEAVATQLLPHGKAYQWNQALMDYSSLELKEKKIPVAKQSHFLSSDRYYRGQIIKLILHMQQITLSGLLDYFHEKNPIEPSRLEAILSKMEKDGLIQKKEEKFLLSDL